MKKLFTVALIISIIILFMDIIFIIHTSLTVSVPFVKKLLLIIAIVIAIMSIISIVIGIIKLKRM